MIHLLSPEKVEDKLQFQILGNAVDTNVRHKFAYINQANLIAQAKEFGKTKDSGSKASFPEAFAMVKANDEAIPASIIAKILKVKVLELRDNELAARDDANKVRMLFNSLFHSLFHSNVLLQLRLYIYCCHYLMLTP